MNRLPIAKKQLVWNAVGYKPNSEMLKAHTSTNRFVLVAGGERGGKSRGAAAEATANIAALDNGLVWFVGPTYDLARPEFEYTLEDLTKLKLVIPSSVSFPKTGPCSFKTVTGVQVVTRSADDPKKLAAKAPNFVVMCEAAQCDQETFLRLTGRIAEKHGWLWISGTFEQLEHRWYVDYYNRWKTQNDDGGISFSVPTWDNLAVFPKGREDSEIKRLEATYPADVFQERFGGLPVPPATLVFKEFSHDKHVRQAPFWDGDENWRKFPVEIAVDPGYGESAYCVLAIQHAGDVVWVIDEIYERGMMVDDIINLCKTRDWWNYVKGGVGDFAVRQHHDAMMSTQELWMKQTGIYLRNQFIHIPIGINRVKSYLTRPGTNDPRMFFDPRCKMTSWELSMGYKWRQVSEGKPVGDEPIDANNHAAKALAYWLVDKFGSIESRPRQNILRSDKPVQHPFAMELGKG